MQATKKLENTKEGMQQAADQLVHDVNQGIEKVEDGAERLAEGVKDVVEDAVDAVLPKAERIVSTMNRRYSMFHALSEEVKCCWKHAHPRWANSILGPNLLQPADEDSEWAFIRGCFRDWRLGPLIQLVSLLYSPTPLHASPPFSILLHPSPSFSILLHPSPSFSILLHPSPSFSILLHPSPSFSILLHPSPSFSILLHPIFLVDSSPFMLSFGSLLFPPLGFLLLFCLWERSYITEVGSREAMVRTTRARERWVFVNGMCVDNNLGQANATQLSKLFHRQVGFFHNPTQGLLFDFVECMVGRTFKLQTPVSRSLTAYLTTALQNHDFEKVVLVVHSQGAIIASNAIDLLVERRIPMKKLEVFTFGSAADEFAQIYDESTRQSYPYYEHFANEHDYVAKIGILHWHVPGAVFTSPKDGHFLGDHYLPYFKQGLFKLYCGPRSAQPKLYPLLYLLLSPLFPYGGLRRHQRYSYLDTANREKATDPVKPLKKEKPVQPTCPTLPHPPYSSIHHLPPYVSSLPQDMLSRSIACTSRTISQYPLSPQRAQLHTPPNSSPPHLLRNNLSPIPLSPIPPFWSTNDLSPTKPYPSSLPPTSPTSLPPSSLSPSLLSPTYLSPPPVKRSAPIAQAPQM